MHLSKRTFLIVLLFCCSLTGHAQVNTIDSIVKRGMEKEHIAGLSLGIVKDGKVILSKGYGFANVKDSLTATENTVYRLGSLSKQFIATAIMVLAEEGKLSLSDPIRKYFKDAPEAWEQITVRNLLNHTSGLERDSRVMSLTKIQPDSFIIQSAYYDTLLFSPGTKWAYSNLGYFVLADIIRKASGQSFEDYMNHFFSSCGLANTVTTNRSKSIYKAKGYKYNYESEKNSEVPDYVVLSPSGAFSSSIVDMIKWDSIQRENKVLSKADWTKMREDTFKISTTSTSKVYYGYGWFSRTQERHRLIFHGGNPRGGGFTSTYWNFIDDKISIIVLANATEVPLDKIALKIAASLNPDYKPATQPIANIEQYIGLYSNKELKMKIRVSDDDGQLIAQASGQPAFPLKNSGKDVFKFEPAGIEMDFYPEKKNFVLKQEGTSDTFLKEE